MKHVDGCPGASELCPLDSFLSALGRWTMAPDLWLEECQRGIPATLTASRPETQTSQAGPVPPPADRGLGWILSVSTASFLVGAGTACLLLMGNGAKQAAARRARWWWRGEVPFSLVQEAPHPPHPPASVRDDARGSSSMDFELGTYHGKFPPPVAVEVTRGAKGPSGERRPLHGPLDRLELR